MPHSAYSSKEREATMSLNTKCLKLNICSIIYHNTIFFQPVQPLLITQLENDFPFRCVTLATYVLQCKLHNHLVLTAVFIKVLLVPALTNSLQSTIESIQVAIIIEAVQL
jgi:hypothetical protein